MRVLIPARDADALAAAARGDVRGVGADRHNAVDDAGEVCGLRVGRVEIVDVVVGRVVFLDSMSAARVLQWRYFGWGIGGEGTHDIEGKHIEEVVARSNHLGGSTQRRRSGLAPQRQEGVWVSRNAW